MQILNQNTYRNKIIYYFISVLFSFVILLLYNILLTSIFLPVEYGKYKFVLSFLTLSALVFDGGLFPASAFDLASSEHDQRQRLGTIILLTTIISVFFIIFIYLSTYYIDALFKKNIKLIIISILPFVLITPFHEIINYIFQGLHKISYLATHKVMPRLFALVIVFVFRQHFIQNQNVATILIVDLLCGAFFIIYLLVRCKPSFLNFKAHSASLIQRIKQFGFKIYIATLFHDALGHAIIVVTSLFLPLNEVGIYTAAIVICTPVLITGKSFGVVLYKYFAVNLVIKKKTLLTFISILVLEALFLYVFRIKIVSTFFSKHYMDIVTILPFIAVSMALQSVSHLFYVFFTATGRGQHCLNMNVFFGLAFIVFVIILTPEFELMGVALSLLIASIIAMVIGIFYAHDKIIS